MRPFKHIGVDLDYQTVSPDGKFVLIAGSSGGRQNLYLYPIDTSSGEPPVARQITSTALPKNAAQFTLKSFLRAHGVNRIQRLALTEGDVKDCGGTKALNEAFGIDELWTSGARFRSAIYHDAVATFETKPGAHQFFNVGDTNGFWRMLWPVETNRLGRADDNALVLCGDLGGTRVLLLSDLSRSAQSGLLEAGAEVRADIVVAGLPDEGEPLSDALLEAIGPMVVVIADAEFPATRRANQKLKDRLAQKNVPVIYTREAGAVKIVADGAGWRLQTMAGQTFDGRR